MKLLSVELENWRAYSEARFDFQSNTSKNIVVIGGGNGYGKTSFFEAVTLCLYGKSIYNKLTDDKLGVSLLDRASHSVSYDDFLCEVIHRDALQQSIKHISVRLRFEKSNGAGLAVERRWFFSSAGAHKRGDEQFNIRLKGQPLRPDEGQSWEDWESDIISEHFIPRNVAGFFLFDGEMVQRLAKMDMATQVKKGIEDLMGIPILTELQGDLKKYAVKKRGEVKTPKDSGSPKELSEAIEQDQKTLDNLNNELDGYDTQKHALHQRQDGLYQELSSLDASSKELSDLYQMQSDIQTQINESEEAIEKQIVSGFALGLTGQNTIKNAIELLERDKILEDWKASKDQGAKGYEKFLNAIDGHLKSTDCDIPPEFHASVRKLIEQNWDKIWYPKPENCPEEIYFKELAGSMRGAITKHLESSTREAAVGISDQFSRLEDLRKQRNDKDKEINNQQSIGPRGDEIAKELKEIQKNLEELNEQIGSTSADATALQGKINTKKAELGQLTSIYETSQPIIQRAKRAEEVSKFIDRVISDLLPVQADDLAKCMTEIYINLSNKNIVQKVAIDKDFGVRLLNAKGDDVREIAMSAGEEQIFSQALISAVVEVSNFDFPMIIDTPLARLDEAHRKSILEYFMRSGRQVIFLSTDTEVVEKYFATTKDRISDTWRINHHNQDGKGYSTVARGYFE